jgi:hypothetical protein
MRYTCRGLLVLSVGTFCAAVAAADELTTTGGKKLTGSLVAVDAGGVTFRAEAAEVKVPAKDILLIDFGHKAHAPAKDAKYTEVELTDGSVIRCSKFLIKGKKFYPELLPGPANVKPPAFDLPLGSVFHVLRGAEDPKNRAAWKSMLLSRGKRDLYVIRQAAGLNFVQGTLIEGNEAGDEVIFEQVGGAKEPLRLSRATAGLVFNQPPQPRVPPTLCKVNDVFGNALVAQAVEVTGGGVRVKTVSGVDVNYPSAQAVAALDYGQGNVAYLSDLEPVVAAPDRDAGDPRFTLLRDRNQANEPIKLDNVVYPKGLWVYPDTGLTFTLNGEYREFKTVVGLDEALTNATSAAKVTIEADNQVLFSETLKRTDKPKVLTLDVKAAKQLKVSVEADTPYNGGQVVFADAKVQK